MLLRRALTAAGSGQRIDIAGSNRRCNGESRHNLLDRERETADVHSITDPEGTARQARLQRFYGDFRERKKVEQIIRESGGSNRPLTRLHLIPLGLAVVIGAGAYSRTTEVVNEHGPQSSLVGLVLAGIAALAAALCFAELASTVPVGGSAYTYAFASFGRFIGWLVLWMILIQYSAGAAAIAFSWAQLLSPDRRLAAVISLALLVLIFVALVWVDKPRVRRTAIAYIAFAAVVKVGALLGLNLAVFAGALPAATVAVGADIQPDAPLSLAALLPAFAVLYFAFLGFDAISTVAEEVRYPQKDLAPSILIVLSCAGGLYLLSMLGVLLRGGATDGDWVLNVAAVIGLPAGVAILVFGQSRILIAAWRDLGIPGPTRSRPPAPTNAPRPNVSSRSGRSPQRETRWRSALCSSALALIGIIITFTLGVTEVTILANFGMAIAFAVVAIGTVVLRVRRPDLPRTFRVPFLPAVASINVLASLMIVGAAAPSVDGSLSWIPLWIGIAWIVVGVVLYIVLAALRSGIIPDTSTRSNHEP
jgi:APA family basic amino acid/polyamine antiporter